MSRGKTNSVEMNNKITLNLDKVGKKKRKFLMKRMGNLDASKIEEILEGKAKSKDISFKNKKKKKQKKKVVSVSNITVNEVPKAVEAISSNWNAMESKVKQEKTVFKEKKIFYRRNKDGKLVTNDPHMKENIASKSDSIKSEETNDAGTSEVWFDDVDPMLLDTGLDQTDTLNPSENGLVKEKATKGITKVLGMDCEMVGVGYEGTDSILARVSIVNHFGHTVYDKFVAPREKVTDYRTSVSGVRPQDLAGAPPFQEVQQEVADIIKGRLLVGHALKHDLKVLFLDHPKKLIRDTSKYKPFKNAFGGRTPSLKNLVARFLGVAVQTGEHSSVQDSQAAVRLYTLVRKEWEEQIRAKSKNIDSKKAKKSQKKEVVERFKVDSKIPPVEGSSKRTQYCPSDSE